jgi:hypothetical protein
MPSAPPSAVHDWRSDAPAYARAGLGCSRPVFAPPLEQSSIFSTAPPPSPMSAAKYLPSPGSHCASCTPSGASVHSSHCAELCVPQVLTHYRGLLQLVDVTFAYPSRPDVHVLDHVSLTIEPATIVALCGPSGSVRHTRLTRTCKARAGQTRSPHPTLELRLQTSASPAVAVAVAILVVLRLHAIARA